MVGRTISHLFPKEDAVIGDTFLEVQGLSRQGEFEDVSFNVCRGEILGVSGLMGAGRSEIMETLFGIRKKSAGKVFIKGKEVKIDSPRDAIAHRIALLTEDRKSSGCFLPLSVRINTTITSLIQNRKSFFLDTKALTRKTEELIRLLSIRTPSTEQKILNLSGGNQQKVLVGRWLLTEPEILIVDEPTRGIDVGAKAEIHRLLVQLAQQGKAIIMISSELPEVLAMSDRIVVVCAGRVRTTLVAKDTTQEEIMKYATGVA